jgi:methyltransferase
VIAILVVCGLVALQRLLELRYADRNTRALLARGAVETGAAHYPFFILLHGSWLICTTIVAIATRAPTNWWLIGFFGLLQAGRVWVIATLGPYWTTRLISMPGAPLVRSGPFRFVRHPNYLIVTIEIATLPLAFGEYLVAIGFTVLNLALLAVRIREEERALANRPVG